MTAPNNQPAPEGFRKLSSKWLETNPLPVDARYYNVLFKSWESTKWAGYLLDHVVNQGYTYATARTDLPREAYADSEEIRPMTAEERKALNEFTMAELRSEPGAEVASERAEAKAIRERAAFLTAHRACHSAEHDPANGKLHGYCVVCGVPFPCDFAKPQEESTIATLRAQLEAKDQELHNMDANVKAVFSINQDLLAQRDKLRAEVEKCGEAINHHIVMEDGFRKEITRLTTDLDAVRKERDEYAELASRALNHNSELNKQRDTALAAKDAALDVLRHFMSCMSRYGNWDDGCFYYNGTSATELVMPIEEARAALTPTPTQESPAGGQDSRQAREYALELKGKLEVMEAARNSAIADRDRMADEREKLKAILGVGGLHYQPNLPIALETRLHAEKGRRDQLATESAGLKLERFALAEQCAKLQIRVGELEASLEEARKVPSVEAKERAEKECAELREELRRWHSIANDFANRRNRAEISAADLRESIADLEEAHGGALIAQAAAVRGMETAEEQFRKAAEWNKLTNLEIENLRSLNAGLEEDLITERNPNVDGSLAFHLASSNQRENDLRTLLLELCEKMEAGLSGAEETKRARAMLGDDPAGGVTISTEKKGGDEPCAPKETKSLDSITPQKPGENDSEKMKTSASNPQPESPIPSGVGQPDNLDSSGGIISAKPTLQ